VAQTSSGQPPSLFISTRRGHHVSLYPAEKEGWNSLSLLLSRQIPPLRRCNWNSTCLPRHAAS